MMPHTSNDLATISLSFDRTLCAFSTQSTISCLPGGGSLKSGFDEGSGIFSMTLDTCSTQLFRKMALKALLMHTSIGWHFDVHPAGIIRASHLFSTNLLSTSSVLCAANASYVNSEFSNPISLETFLMYSN